MRSALPPAGEPPVCVKRSPESRLQHNQGCRLWPRKIRDRVFDDEDHLRHGERRAAYPSSKTNEATTAQRSSSSPSPSPSSTHETPPRFFGRGHTLWCFCAIMPHPATHIRHVASSLILCSANSTTAWLCCTRGVGPIPSVHQRLRSRGRPLVYGSRPLHHVLWLPPLL
jgi:hypothetical protein